MKTGIIKFPNNFTPISSVWSSSLKGSGIQKMKEDIENVFDDACTILEQP